MTRAFIIGNGPSLAQTPLELLQQNKEISFAVNRIHFHYPSTTWRPTHYVRAEEQSLKDATKYHDEVRLHIEMGCEVWVNHWFTKTTDMNDKVNRIKACFHYNNHFDQDKAPHLWHLPLLCSFGSSVNVAIQIAVQQGFGPLYLVGCDLGYRDGQPNHMHPDYEKDIQEDLRPAKYANLDTLNAHMVAVRSSPVKIYNAGIGGELEVYERMEFRSLFQ
jgi:hypothetical protein